MNIAKIFSEVERLEKSGFTREQAITQVSTMDDVIEDRITPIIDRFRDDIEKVKLEMIVKLGSIMAVGISIMIFLK